MKSHELAAELAKQICSLPAGHRVDSECVIMRRFGVSRSTVRAALKLLQDQYLVRRSQGKGTLVNHRLDYVISKSRRPSAHDAIEAAGGSQYTRVQSSEIVGIPSVLAKRMEIPADTPVRKLVRIGYINDAISSYYQEWLRLDHIDHIDVGLRVFQSIDIFLRGRGLDPVRAWCRIGLEIPDSTVRQELELGYAAQAWVVESLSRDRNSNRTLMCSTTWSRPDMVRITLEMEE